ncbi:hypothetical protein D9611_012258 [Ephemerocybe angulata]|uniref:Transcription activator GCR1-like domain-containing protein n=1 Tax=Ephemerocybe angulata TaxID=980116 RepID=A0A8H5ATU3_9AGAR|nr:hypothetical protein D9611_012258 [Tulosesus angulatus]
MESTKSAGLVSVLEPPTVPVAVHPTEESKPRIKMEPAPNFNASTLYTIPGSHGTGSDVNSCQPWSVTPTAPTIWDLANTADTYAQLQSEVKANASARQAEREDNANTHLAYSRQLKVYEDWWSKDQARRVEEAIANGTSYAPVPARPIDCLKVAIYLEHERTRMTIGTDGKPIPNTSLSKESLAQVVSALESYRFEETGDKRDRLRGDKRIQDILASADQNEAKRQRESQQLKANGAHSQTLTRDEWREVALGMLLEHGHKKSLQINIRDRAMFLVSRAAIMRGDNVRPICWSDLSMREIGLINMGDDHRVKALVIMSNEGKTNKRGRLDLHPTLRHRFPELCPIFAIALQLFSYFHIGNGARPMFEPDYESPKASNVGFRSWYDWRLFPNSAEESMAESLSPRAHRDRVNIIKSKYNITCIKVTHAGRVSGAEGAIEGGATVDGTKKLGLWSQGGSFEGSYASATLPLNAMLALAYFNGERKDNYYVSRDFMNPPDELCSLIFPWIEQEETAYEIRVVQDSAKARDQSLVNFLEVLRWFRRILLQDMAALAWKHPEVPFLRFAPFNTESFRSFANTAGSVIEKAEEDVRNNQRNLPEVLAATFAGHLQAIHAQNHLNFQRLETLQENVEYQSTSMSHALAASLTGPSRKRKATSQEIPGAVRSPPAPTAALQALALQPAVAPELTTQSAAPASTNSASTHSSAQVRTVVSGQGHIYAAHTFPMSSRPEEYARQMLGISALEEKFSFEQLKYQSFDWVPTDVSHSWLPRFEWWKPNGGSLPTLADVWKEYSEGIGHRFSILQLNEQWGARWKRDVRSIKSEFTRRMKIVRLIEGLMKQNEWSCDYALEFLSSEYPIAAGPGSPSHLRSSRSFSDWLKDSTSNAVLAASKLYTSQI